MNNVTVLPNALTRRGVSPLTSNQDSDYVPFQRWYNFKEAFAPQLVANVIRATARAPETCLDPFGGSGTTAITCQFLGIRPVIIEVNPFLADLAEAKLTTYDVDALTSDRGRLADFLAYEAKRGLPGEAFSGCPPTLVEPGVNGRWIFDQPVAERIWQYRQFLDRMENRDHARLLRVLLGSVLVPLSNITISGKGRRYRRNWKERRADTSKLDLMFHAAFERALYDICRYSYRPCTEYEIRRGDARTMITEDGEVDLVITSPPYPNSFDYTDIYNIELWALGYLQSKADNRTLREATLRSHVQIKRSFDRPAITSPVLARTLASLHDAVDRLWDKDIPAMVGAYFADLETVVAGVRGRLHDSGTAAFVVGDSRYADVHIDVAAIMAEISEGCDFRVAEQYPVRSMRSSPQHGGRFDLTEWLIRLVPA